MWKVASCRRKGLSKAEHKQDSIDVWMIIRLDTDAAHADRAGTVEHFIIDREAFVNLSITLSESNQG